MAIKFVWDTSVFMGVLNRQTDLPVEEIQQISNEIAEKKVILLVPAIIHAEILLAQYTPEVIEKLYAFLDRENVEKVDLDEDICKLAAKIRSLMIPHRRKRDYGIWDALVLATAIIHQAVVVHSLDKDDMVKYSESELVLGQKITRPAALTK
ncbi:MAG TPA: PIN domain-containing protein [Gemmatales bacterium]|nr:PIN domain-containing protein [Gemmatales bacterium]HMP17433.1 PIN domain-containing protein [Gemmatales bacterium]